MDQRFEQFREGGFEHLVCAFAGGIIEILGEADMYIDDVAAGRIQPEQVGTSLAEQLLRLAHRSWPNVAAANDERSGLKVRNRLDHLIQKVGIIFGRHYQRQHSILSPGSTGAHNRIRYPTIHAYITFPTRGRF